MKRQSETVGQLNRDSVSFAQAGLLDSPRVAVTAATITDLTGLGLTSRHIDIRGATTIEQFNLAEGECFFVRFNWKLILVHSANLITQNGENILTGAGDTCIIRGIGSDQVEILCYSRAAQEKAIAFVTAEGSNANGHYRVWSDGRIEQWGRYPAGNTNVTHTLPIPFTDVSGAWGTACNLHSPAATSPTNLGEITLTTIQLDRAGSGTREVYWYAEAS